jgi:hypothetical protein
MKHLTDTYLARDEWGRTYTIYVFTEISLASPVDGASAVSAAMPELRTCDGDIVVPIGEGLYQVEASGMRLWLDGTARAAGA